MLLSIIADLGPQAQTRAGHQVQVAQAQVIQVLALVAQVLVVQAQVVQVQVVHQTLPVQAHLQVVQIITVSQSVHPALTTSTIHLLVASASKVNVDQLLV